MIKRIQRSSLKRKLPSYPYNSLNTGDVVPEPGLVEEGQEATKLLVLLLRMVVDSLDYSYYTIDRRRWNYRCILF